MLLKRRSRLALFATGVLAAGVLTGIASVALAADPMVSRNKPVTTSSTETSAFSGLKAVDGDAKTRWASKEGHDPEWIRVDLGDSYHVSRVVLRWEAAYASGYKIQVSDNDSVWKDAFSTTTGKGGVEDRKINATGRYIRMYGTKRGTPYGYSLFEFEVYGSNGKLDTKAPTPPGNLRVVGDVKPNSLQLQWEPSTDDVGVEMYDIYNGGNILTTVGGNVTQAVVDKLTSNTRYIITVAARDKADNVSQASNRLDITTPKSDDTVKPTPPTNVHESNVGATSITLSWTAATDNVEVTGYDVFRGATKVASVPDLTATDDGLTPNTAYTYTVVARDANGNTSDPSAARTVRTTATGGAGGGDPIVDHEVTKLDEPWGIDFLPDNSALVAERDRFEIVHVTLDGKKDVVGKVPGAVTTNGEGGVLGLAISPNFNSDHFVYIYHTASGDNRVVRMKYENGKLGTTSEALVTGIKKNQFHNGGRIRFGPDGMLYIATGDAKSGNLAQSLSSLNGKILRVTPDGKGAPGNPFPSAPRVYSLGHRNVQGLAWDSKGRLWASELGESTWDELNLIEAGNNYGWPTCEGKCNNSNFVDPVRQWDVSAASPSGLEIVNDTVYMAALRGSRLWVMKIQGDATDTPRAFFNNKFGRLRTVVKTPDGGLWLASSNNDKSGGTPDVIDNVIVRLKFAS